MEENIPNWLAKLLKDNTDAMAKLTKQNEKMASIIEEKLKENESEEPPTKKHKSHEVPLPHDESQSYPQPPEEDSEDEFESRYGHLIGTHINGDDSDPGEENQGKDDDNDNDNDSVASVDEDLVDLLEKVPNWDTSSSIKKFISNSIDRPLPDAVLKQLNEDFTPKADVMEFFKAPEMPPKLFKDISKMKSKGAIKTEKALFNAQTELFIVAKPILAALIELRELGCAVKKSREILSVSLRGIYSVSLRISTARRENVRFLFKEALAESLFSYLPNHSQLFGGTSFSSQLEKAAKEAKINISWSKPKQFNNNFRNSQGFQYSRGAGRFFTQQYRNQGSRSYNNNNNYNNYKGNNYNRNNRGNNNRSNNSNNSNNKANQGRQNQK